MALILHHSNCHVLMLITEESEKCRVVISNHRQGHCILACIRLQEPERKSKSLCLVAVLDVNLSREVCVVSIRSCIARASTFQRTAITCKYTQANRFRGVE